MPRAPHLPEQIEPMQAMQADAPFDSPDHLFEIKWDGTRCVAFVQPGSVRLQNRRFADLTPRYPELAGLRNIGQIAILDGEIVVMQAGKPSFSHLAQRDQARSARKVELLRKSLPATFVAFDLLAARGADIMRRPLVERRALLRDMVNELADPSVVFSESVVARGRDYFAAAEQAGLEGIMAKRLQSIYLPGRRSPDWLKIKVARTEIFDLIGYTVQDHGAGVRALLIGQAAGASWQFRGSVGSGMKEAQRVELLAALAPLPKLPQPPADGPREKPHWRSTGLRCRVRFFEISARGVLRSPVFLGWVSSSP